VTQTFDIRFERTAGLASFFAAAENVFRWKGAGRLSIDPQGISIAARRGLTTLFAHRSSHRISASDLREVYREGAALRVEFKAGNQPRVVLPFWARDRDTAAQIVRLLPTSRTVELEHGPSERRPGNFRPDVAALVIAALGLAVILGAAWKLSVTPEASQPVQGIAIEPEFVPIPVELPELPLVPLAAIVTDADRLNLAITPGSSAFGAAQRYTAEFEEQARAIEGRYRASWQLHADERITTEEYASRLDEHAMRWWDFTFRTLDNPALSAPDLLDLRAAMLGIARHWRNFLTGYAAGLRTGDHVAIARSFDSLTRAEEMRARLRAAMGQLGGTPTNPAYSPPLPSGVDPPRRLAPPPAQTATPTARSSDTTHSTADSKPPGTGAGADASGVTATPPADSEEVEPFVPSTPGIRVIPGDTVVPLRATSVAHHTATELLRWFEKVATENTEKFAGHLADVDAGRTDERQFLRDLETLDFRWRNLASGLLSSPEARTPELTGFRSTLLAVTRYQSSFLTGYASGLRTRDQDAIAKAYAERDRADQALERARLYVR
jgi:hypothetical protein